MIRKILVPTDFSTCSEDALAYAIDLAHAVDASVTALHCYMPAVPIGPDAGVLIPTPDMITAMATEAEKRIREWVQHYADKNSLLDGKSEYGPAAESIVETANEEGYDLIVMGTHGRTGFRHLLLGSVAERVVRISTVPVLTVHPEIAQHGMEHGVER